MSVFQNSNVVFRCPLSLKEKMKALAEQREEHLSTLIRSACVEVLRREYPLNCSKVVNASKLEASE
jgi:hypothetical protein